MRSRLVLAGICLSVLAGCGGNGYSSGGNHHDPPPDTESVSGTVTFKGAPLADATVTNFLTNSNIVYGVTTTDANGRWSFSGMKTTGNVPGEYQIYVNKAGYGFYPSVASGGKVIRADYTGQYKGAGIAPSGLLFTVIDFDAIPDSAVSGATFAAFDGTNPPVRLAATGQQNISAPGDDGSVKAGVAWDASTRFTDNQDGTVTDLLTGLTWLQDAGCLGQAFWSDGLTAVNTLASGNCGLRDSSTAGQWRMPNLIELESLIDASQANPAVSAASHFANVQAGIYWTSTSYYGGVGGSDKAWTIRLSDGRYMNDTTANVKASSSNYLWAVKGAGTGGLVQLQSTGFSIPYAAGDDGTFQTGVPLISSRFIDNNNGTLTDTMTGLVWLKLANCAQLQGQWSDSLAAVNALGTGVCGLNDGSQPGTWRMPNRNELQSLADRRQTNQAQYFDYTYLNQDNSVFQAPIFTNYEETQFYWTSTTDAADPTEAWTVYSCDFGVYDIPKTSVGYTLAVR